MAGLRLFLLFFFVYSTLGQESDYPVTRVAQGIIAGRWRVSANGRTYASFEGVPYARPPVGKYRFHEPLPMKSWGGVWNASRVLSPCLQYDPFVKKIIGSEDCLYINIHTPKLTPGPNLPVMVFIHGGAFMYGSGGAYGAEKLMDKDMVVVTFNYRLGPLGFLSTGDDVIPGNAGLKDQSLALRWVRENIVMFGGDPDSVTLTGCSAGGASVHYHYLSPMSRGTFVRGIAFSGSAFASWTHAIKPTEKALELADIVGCPYVTTREMVDCLKYRPAEMIVYAQIEMFEWKVHMFTPFTPTVEARSVRDPFLTQYPLRLALSGKMARLPLITSVTSEEGLYPAAAYQEDPSLLTDLEARWDQLASNIFEYNDTLSVHMRSDVARKIKQRYLGGKPVSQDTFGELVQALGDRLFVADVGRLAQIHALKSEQSVHVYKYSYRASKSLSMLMAHNDKNYGVSHADDVMHLFSFEGLDMDTEEDKKIRNVLIDMVYYYVSTGYAKIKGAPDWLAVRPGATKLNYMEISSPSSFEMKSSADFGQRSFWDNLGLVENERYLFIRDEPRRDEL